MYSTLRKIELISFFLLSFSLQISAPVWKSLTIYEVQPIEPYKKLIFAIGMVETKGNTMAFNPLENAAGCFQIRPIRLIEYNRQTGNKFNRRDLFNYAVSEKIFLYFADKIGPYNPEMIARKWNGSGKLTTAYWNRIKQLL
jgi:hypothetical protein